MIDLDKYINQTIEFKLEDEVLHIKQPSAASTMRIAKLEKEILKDGSDYLTKRCEITEIILNNNEEGVHFASEDVGRIPFKVQTIIAREIGDMQVEAEQDPNS